jgi:hypothetical protein
VLASSLAVTPAAASAHWGEIERIGPERAEQPLPVVLAGNARGDAVAAWQAESDVEVAISRRGGPFAPARRVPGSRNGRTVAIDLNERGKAIIAWVEGDLTATTHGRVHVAGLHVDRGFGRSRPITSSAANRALYDVMIGPRGQSAVVYDDGQSRLGLLRARAAGPLGRFGPVRRFGDRSELVALSFRDRRFHVLYHRESRPGTLRERAVAAGADSHVVRAEPRDGEIAVATAPNGRQAAIWRNGGKTFAGTRAPGRHFVGRKVMDGVPGGTLDVDIAPSGAAIAAWSDRDDDGGGTHVEPAPGSIVTTYRPPDESFRDVRAFRPTAVPVFVMGIALAVDSKGRSVIGWEAQPQMGAVVRSYAAFQVRGGEFRDVRRLGTGFATYRGAAIDARGRAHLAWEQEVPGGQEAAARQVWAIRGHVPR